MLVFTPLYERGVREDLIHTRANDNNPQPKDCLML